MAKYKAIDSHAQSYKALPPGLTSVKSTSKTATKMSSRNPRIFFAMKTKVVGKIGTTGGENAAGPEGQGCLLCGIGYPIN